MDYTGMYNNNRATKYKQTPFGRGGEKLNGLLGGSTKQIGRRPNHDCNCYERDVDGNLTGGGIMQTSCRTSCKRCCRKAFGENWDGSWAIEEANGGKRRFYSSGGNDYVLPIYSQR